MSDKKINHLLEKIRYLSDKCREKDNKIKLLEEAKFSYEYIIANIPSHVYWLDKDNKYLGCNDAHAKTINLKSSSEIVGKSNYDMPWKEQADLINQVNAEVIRTGKAHKKEEFTNIDNVIRYYISEKSPLRDKDNNIIGLLGVSMDITERKQMEMELEFAKKEAEVANQAKTEFIANMSHDIRTPLTGVIGLSKILERDISDPVQKEEAHLLAESGVQLLDMLNEVLEDVRAGNSNDVDILNENFDLYSIIDTLVKLEAPTTTAQNIDLDSSIADDVPQYIFSDRRKITHILLNLLGNSIKFTKTGKVTIEVTVLDKNKSHVHLRFGVIDTGIGIPKVLQEKVFDRFFKVETSFKGVYSGYGLGLHIVKSYVNLLGGNITIASKEGYGTSVYFDLECPIGKKELIAKAETEHAEIETTEASPNQCQVLLVEDNRVALKVFEDVIAKSNLMSQSATSGEQAFKLLQRHNFDFIVTDLGLPGISGQELAQKIRALEKEMPGKNMPIFGLTAHVNTEIAGECAGFGMNGVYTKPVSQDNLKEMLDAVQSLKNNIPVQHKSQVITDLPSTEAELFNINEQPILDVNYALQAIGGDVDLYNDILRSLVTDELPAELDAIAKAHAKEDLEEVARLVHRLKSGVIYVGAKRLSSACLYLERYYKTGQTKLLAKLYQQFLNVASDTVRALQKHLDV